MEIQTQILDTDTLVANMSAELKARFGFDAVDYESSNAHIVAHILAYNVGVLSYYVNTGINEGFLISAQKRANVVSGAKPLSYIPRRPIGSVANVLISLISTSIPNGIDSSYTVTIPAETIFTGGGYTFMSTDVITLEYVNATTISGSGNIKQVVKDTNLSFGSSIAPKTYDNDKHNKLRFKSFNVDNDYLIVTVNGEVWTSDRDSELTEITATSKVYFMSEYSNGVEIKFGDNQIGATPANGIDFYVDIYTTSGAASNSASVFVMTSGVGLVDNLNPNPTTFTINDFVISTNTPASGGSDIESINSIRTNAPRVYAAQNRIVTAPDCAAKIMDAETPAHINITPIDCNSWGGENNVPRTLGTIFSSILKDDLTQLSAPEKSVVVDYLKQFSVATISHQIVDHNTLYVDLASKVRIFNKGNESSIRNAMLSTINSYMTSLVGFNTNFRRSKLEELIGLIPNVASNNIEVSLTYRLAGKTYKKYSNYLTRNIKAGTLTGAWLGLNITDSNGIILYDGANIGTINYTTGAIEFIMGTGPAVGQYIDLSYTLDSDDFSSQFNTIMSLRNVVTSIERLSVNV